MATVVVKSADESRTSNTTFADDNELKFTVGASEIWVAHFALYFSSGAPGDAKLTFAGPSGSTGTFFDLQWNIQAFNFGDTDAITGLNLNLGLVFLSVQIINGSTVGTCALQWAQNSSNVTPTILKQNSSLIALKQ